MSSNLWKHRPPPAVVVATLVWCMVLLGTAGSAARASTVLSFVPSVAEVNCTQYVEIDLVIDGGAADLRGYSIELAFDASLLQLVDVVPGQLLEDAPCDPFLRWSELGPGQVLVDAAGLGCSVAGPGAIARLRMLGVADGLSQVIASELVLRNSANLAIAATAVDGEIRVNCPVSQGGSTWTTLKSSFR